MRAGKVALPGLLRFAYLVAWLTLIEQRHQYRRIFFMVLTMAVAVGAWWGLSAMASPFVTTAHPDKSHDITVRSHRGRISQPVPERYATRIAALPGAQDVYYSDLSIIQCGGSGFSVTINAWGGAGTADALRQEGYAAAQIHAFQHDPLAILTDAKTASRCGWHPGQGISPDNFRGKPVQLHVRGIIQQKDRSGTAIAHYDYINRIGGGVTKRHMVTEIHLHAPDPRGNSALAARIQAMFAHDDPPVEAVPDTVNQNAWARFGKVQYLLAFVMAAIFACCALVLTSIMAHVTTQRRAQMALMQVLGFPRLVHWFALMLEMALILAMGTALGLGLGNLAIHWLQRMLGSMFQSIAAPPWTWAWLWPGLCLLLVTALFVPSVIVSRLRPTDCRDLGS